MKRILLLFLLPSFLMSCSLDTASQESEKESSSTISSDAETSSDTDIPSVATYSVTWKNWDGTVLDIEQYIEGQIPTYKSELPTRDPSNQYHYQFSSWDRSILPIFHDTIYTALFDRGFIIAWNNYDGSLLKTTFVVEGDLPFYEGVNPTKPTSTYIYTFIGWNPAVVLATEDATYTAQFSSQYGFEFEAISGGYRLTNCLLTDATNIEIPLTYNYGAPVLEIKEGALSQCNSVASLTVPFLGLSSSNSAPLNMLFGFVPETLKSITILNGTTICDEAFSESNLERIIFAENIESIGKRAFKNCNMLRELIIPETVSFYDEEILSGCFSLESITLPYASSISYLFGVNDFLDTGYAPSSLKTIEFLSGTSINDNAFKNCSEITSVILPSTIVSIGSSAFDGCSKLTSIPNYEGIEAIGDNAFLNCFSLCSINLPAIKSIGNNAFKNCINVSEIEISNLLESFGTNVFNGCSNVKKITFPNNQASQSDSYLKKLGFSDEEAKNILEVVIVPSSNALNPSNVISEYAFYNCDTIKSISIPYGIEKISEYAFYNCTSLESVSIPNTVVSIDQRAFKNCSSLVSISLPSSLTSIGHEAFMSCTSLESVTIPNGVTTLSSAFCNCYSLKTVMLPNSLSDIGESFRTCRSLKTINIPEGVTFLSNFAFDGCSSLETITLPDSINDIGGEAFWGCKSLKTISIPNGVTGLKGGVFYGCESLESIYLTKYVTSISNSTFNGCTSLHTIFIPNDNEYFSAESGVLFSKDKQRIIACPSVGPTFDIPSSVNRIEDRAFYQNQNIESITIPSNVTYLGEFAFFDCESLETVSIQRGLAAIQKQTFQECISLKNLSIPSSVTTIGYGAFSGCRLLESIILPDSLKNIEEAAFSATGLRAVTIPEGVETIGDYAFQYDWLGDITLPSSLLSVGKLVFNYSLSYVTVLGKSTSFQSDSFEQKTHLAHCITCNNSDFLNLIDSGALEVDTIYYLGDYSSFDYASLIEKTYFYSETAPEFSGNYWHYVNGAPEAW